jgi:mitochondrial import inner membrane translocase subunit TIM50
MFRIVNRSRSLVNYRSFSQLDKAARKAKYQEIYNKSNRGNTGLLIGASVFGIIGYAVYDVKNNTEGFLSKAYKGSTLEKMLNKLYQATFGQLDEVFLPTSDKLLPDWGDPVFYGQIPPGAMPLPLLVVDLEKTLIGSVHDSQYGWRHAKRPGLDKFLRDLSGYYEIVIFSENDLGVSQDILMAIDPENRCHKFGAAHAEARGNVMLKRLDLMNRDLRRIILIDDNPASAQLFPRNTLFVKPFTDIHNNHDSVLYDLVPLLQAFVHEDVQDFPAILDSLGTHDAEEAATEYRMRLIKQKTEQEMKKNKGLGALIRGKNVANDLDDGSVRSMIPSPKDIVGAAPMGDDKKLSVLQKINNKDKAVPEKPVEKKKGKLFSALDDWEKDKEEQKIRKHEAINNIVMQRQMSKQSSQSGSS